jgi:chitin synthase
MASQRSPRREKESPRRTPRRRPDDLESHPPVFASPTTPASGQRGSNYQTYNRPYPSPSPGPPGDDLSPMVSQRPAGGGDLSRKKSLIRPERSRIDRDHPHYHYRRHAAGMAVHPSTTGNDPILDEGEEVTTISSESTDLKSLPQRDQRRTRRGTTNDSPPMKEKNAFDDVPLGRKNTGKLHRKATQKELKRMHDDQMRKRDRASVRPPSLWNIYCAIITFWCPDAILRCFGKPAKAQQRAWREKMGLISIILVICAGVGYLTFGFTQTVCPPGASARLRVNSVGPGFMIFHGKAIDLTTSQHPLARGIPAGANVLFDLPTIKYGGYDGSMLFQNVNGDCKDLIRKRDGTGVPSDSDGNLGWYFPCQVFKQDGSSVPNDTNPVYYGYSCHTSKTARTAFYGLKSYGDVYYTWDDIRNSSRNLMVFGSDVLDLNLLDFFNKTEITYPAQFDSIRHNTALRGIDVTRAFASTADKKVGRCLSQIIKVGSIDTTSVGCIASKVVLYVSLVFILSIVVAKFLLALSFQWFLCRKFGATKTTLGNQDSKKRKQQIEDWSDDIYRAPPKMTDQSAFSDRTSKRGSVLFPTTSRFTSPYAIDRSFAKNRAPPTTMASQTSTSRLITGGNSLYKQSNHSQGTLMMDGSYGGKHSLGDGRSSMVLESEGPGPAGFIHEAVVPQPPAEWQPFGYPLAHAICLVTAYSEGQDGLRTTLDSVATTDYPNSHKLILVICDGMIRGKGETDTTPDICLKMMKDHAVLPQEVQPHSYVAVASGSKRHNMAKIYAGFYDYGSNSRIPSEKQERVPMMLVVKCGTPDEKGKSKPGNRGKRDSQIILMSFLQKVMFDERMTELEFEMFNGIWKITGISPDFYEVVLMVDADTKIFPDSMTHMVSAMVKDPEIMGLCGETKIANKRESWVTMIQVFE